MVSTEKEKKTYWALKTNGDVQERVRSFLAALWQQAELDGLVVPVYQAEDGFPGPMVLWSPDKLQDADPFVPLVRMQSSKIVENLARDIPAIHMGAVLHSCEARALIERSHRDGVSLAGWLLIAVDCLASFPQADYEWRMQKAGGARQLTQEILRNARQGGISADRFRSACQMCGKPEAKGVDVCIGVLGLPVKEYALVTVWNEKLAESLGLDKIADGRAPAWLVAQHENVLEQMRERHERVSKQMLAELQDGLPRDVQECIMHLENCAGCKACLDACPLYVDQLEAGVEAVAAWLAACVACGICEDVCPQQLPLTAVIERIVSGSCRNDTHLRDLQADLVTA
jgi:NAD-dependent dihydropyrimidine dehydrogenase PreA subunit